MKSDQKSHLYIISVGSNINPEKHVQSALKKLLLTEELVHATGAVITEAIGIPDAPPFTNLCWLIRSARSPDAMKVFLNQIEKSEGRKPDSSWESRTLDLDISACNGRIIDPDYESRPWLKDQIDTLIALSPAE